MKYVIIAIIAIAAAAGIMLAAYGKNGLKYRKDNGATDIVTAVLMAVIVFFWGLDLFNYIASPDTAEALTVLFVFGAPILLVIWIFYNRNKLKQEMAAKRKKSPRK